MIFFFGSVDNYSISIEDDIMFQNKLYCDNYRNTVPFFILFCYIYCQRAK